MYKRVTRFQQHRVDVGRPIGGWTRYDPNWESATRNLTEGTPARGRVVEVTKRGLVVSLECGVRGFIPASEIPLKLHLSSPRFVSGATETLWILDRDAAKQSIIITFRPPPVGNPWVAAADKYRVGSVVAGVVECSMDHGALVELEPGVKGWISRKSTGLTDVASFRMTFPRGADVMATVRALNIAAKRISLEARGAAGIAQLHPAKSLRDSNQKISAFGAALMAALSRPDDHGGGPETDGNP